MCLASVAWAQQAVEARNEITKANSGQQFDGWGTSMGLDDDFQFALQNGRPTIVVPGLGAAA